MKRIQTEPLPEPRWQRIEQELFARLAEADAAQQPARRVGVGALAFAAAGFCAALLVWGLTSVWRGGVAQPAQLVQIDSGDLPQHFEGAGLRVTAAPHSTLLIASELGSRADPRAAAEHADKLVAVLRGTADVEATQDRESALLVRAGETRVRAQFARFRVALLADQASVSVERGKVEVFTRSGPIILAPGERWPKPAASSLPAAASPVPSAAASPTESAPASATTSGPRATKGSPSTAQPRSQQARYEWAAGLEASQPAEASAEYRKLARERGGWAANALFALGRLELERGVTEAGRAALSEYLARYPHGRNAGDARRLLSRP
jgi:FecR protein